MEKEEEQEEEKEQDGGKKQTGRKKAKHDGLEKKKERKIYIGWW